MASEPDNQELLALPAGQDVRAQWLDLKFRMMGYSGFSFRFEGPGTGPWIHHDPTLPNDPYKYVKTEPNFKWVSIDWYIGWWRRDKEWFPQLDHWIDAKVVLHDFWQNDRLVTDAYRSRHLRKGKTFVDAAERMIAKAETHLTAFQDDHQFLTEFNRTSKKPFAKWIKDRYGIKLDPELLPDLSTPPLVVPDHKGFKQLAIFRDATDETDLALNVCRHAVSIGWPGDWERRIERYTKKLLKSDSPSAGRPTRNKKRAAHQFCTQCGEALDPSDNFCGHCGSKRRV